MISVKFIPYLLSTWFNFNWWVFFSEDSKLRPCWIAQIISRNSKVKPCWIAQLIATNPMGCFLPKIWTSNPSSQSTDRFINLSKQSHWGFDKFLTSYFGVWICCTIFWYQNLHLLGCLFSRMGLKYHWIWVRESWVTDPETTDQAIAMRGVWHVCDQLFRSLDLLYYLLISKFAFTRLLILKNGFQIPLDLS